MGNEMKVVVTRAPRIRKCMYADVPTGSYYLTVPRDDLDAYIVCEKNSPASWIDKAFGLPYDIEFGKNEVVPFDSFEDMCKWVAGGKKVEDLQGDCKSEWVDADSLNLGQFATLLETKCTGPEPVHSPVGDYHTPRVFTVVHHNGLGAGKVLLEFGITTTSGAIFSGPCWPIRFDLGDTIKITAP